MTDPQPIEIEAAEVERLIEQLDVPNAPVTLEREDDRERMYCLSFLREPDFGFAWVAWRWAKGHSLDAVLLDADLAAGDLDGDGFTMHAIRRHA